MGALLVAIASLAVYISLLESQDEANTYSNPWVVAYLVVIGVGIIGIVAILLGANRSLAIPIMTAYLVVGLLGLASIGILLVVAAALVAPAYDG